YATWREGGSASFEQQCRQYTYRITRYVGQRPVQLPPWCKKAEWYPADKRSYGIGQDYHSLCNLEVLKQRYDEYTNDRRSYRIYARRYQSGAAARKHRTDVRRRAPHVPAAGSGCYYGGRNPGSRHGQHGHTRRADRAPGAFYYTYQLGLGYCLAAY